jgi:hypothetical protein
MAGDRIAAARPRTTASFIRAKPERAQHVALSTRGQVVALGARQRLPLFARQPAGIVAFGHVNSFLFGADGCERSRSRDAAAPEFCRPKPRSFCLQKIRGGGAPKRRNCLVRPCHASDVATKCASGTAARSSERARLSALHRGARRGFDPSAQLRAAFPGAAGCKREDPPRRQCSELLADRS